jgi:hypothetical protein
MREAMNCSVPSCSVVVIAGGPASPGIGARTAEARRTRMADR